MDLPTHPASNEKPAIGVCDPGLYSLISAVVGGVPGAGFSLSPRMPSDSRTEYWGPLMTVTGKQGRPSSLARQQGSVRSFSILSTTGSTDSRTERGEGEGDADGRSWARALAGTRSIAANRMRRAPIEPS